MQLASAHQSDGDKGSPKTAPEDKCRFCMVCALSPNTDLETIYAGSYDDAVTNVQLQRKTNCKKEAKCLLNCMSLTVSSDCAILCKHGCNCHVTDEK